MSAPEAGRFLFVVTGHDAEPFVAPLLASLAEQTEQRWRAVFVDDASRDATASVVEREIEAHGLGGRVRVVRNEERRYKTRNVEAVLRGGDAKRSEIVVLLDADDRLAHPDALEVLDREYRRGFDVVWSNWVGSDGSPGKSAALSLLLPPKRQPFVSQHLFSFRRRLFEGVSPRDLRDDEGRCFRAGCDAAIAWAVLEQTPRWRFVDRPLCVYNRANPGSHKHRGNKWEQIRTLAVLQGRSRLRPPVRSAADLRFLLANAPTLVRAAATQVLLVDRYLRQRRRIRHYREGRRRIV